MRRDRRVWEYCVRVVRPWLWRKCSMEGCSIEARREDMLLVRARRRFGESIIRTTTICQGFYCMPCCAKHKEKGVVLHFLKQTAGPEAEQRTKQLRYIFPEILPDF